MNEELFSPGHSGCAGCGGAIAVRLALKAAGKNTIVCNVTGCLEIISTPYPYTAWKVPYCHTAFECAGAVASGVEAALKMQGKKGINVLAIAGDGGTADIGLQALSGALERGHKFTYLMYDNECYANTGVQRSGATPYGAATTTSPAGKVIGGKQEWKKDVTMIVAGHHIPYVATASVSYPHDLMKKVKKALKNQPSFLHVHCPCPTAWRFDSSKTIEVGRLAVETGLWALYEIDDGDPCNKKHNIIPKKRKAAEEYLKMQGRFKHLTEKDFKFIQSKVDEYWAKTEK